jgi:hypothetical protein
MLERLARLGYASIGAVYIIVGLLAAMAGLGEGGSTRGQQGAFAFLLRQPFGRVMLAAIALGMAGYTLWRLVGAMTDTERHGSGAKGVAARAFSAFRGLVYGSFAIAIVRLLTRGEGGSSGDQQARHWTATVMDQPFGRFAVIAAGLGVVGYAAYQLYAAASTKLSKKLRIEQIDGRLRGKVIAISRFGIAARGVVFFIVGGSLVLAGIRHSSREAHGTTGALQELPAPILAAVGFGLAAYGVYALVNARYRTIAT